MNLRLSWLAALICALAMIALLSPGFSRWRPEYAELPQATREWFRTRTLTPAAQARFNFSNCCDHADVVDTKFRVDKTTGNDQWWWLNGTQWQRVPDDIIHWDQHHPEGKAILFVAPSKLPVCFFPPESGN